MKIITRDIQSLSFEDFEKLSLEEKLNLLPLLPPKKRFDFLTDSRDAGKLVKSSPIVDLLLTIKEIGLEGAGALLALCDSEQIQYFMDMDTWEGYTFGKERMHKYLMVLREWDMEVFQEKFCGLDYEQQLLYFLGDFKVYLSKEDFDPDEGAPEESFTIDGLYYLQPLCDEEKALLTRELLILVFDKDRNLYFRLVEGMRQELYSVVEEDLYRFKSSRITELGFYEYEDAIGVYSEPTNIPRDIIPQRIDPFSYSRLPVRYITQIEPISAGFETIDERTALEILFELQVLINRLIIADKLEMFEPESVEMSSEKVKSMLKLGLDVIKSEMGLSPIDAIKKYYVIDIFRHGYKKLKFIRDEARRIRLMHKYLKYVELPLYYEALLKIGSTNFANINLREIFSDATTEYPQNLAEIGRLYDLLCELETSLDIIIKCFNISVEDIERFDFNNTNIAHNLRPTFFNLLMTPMMNMFLGYGLRYLPLKREELAKACKILFIKREEGIFLSEDFLKSIEENIFAKIRENPRYQYARRVIGRTLEEFISELGYIDDYVTIKPEFISILTILNSDFS